MANDNPPVRGSKADGSSFYDASCNQSGDLNADPRYVGAKNYLEQAFSDLGVATWTKGVDFGRSSGHDAGSS